MSELPEMAYEAGRSLPERAYLIAAHWDACAVARFNALPAAADRAELAKLVEAGRAYTACARELRAVVDCWHDEQEASHE